MTKKKKVLVIDDDTYICNLLTNYLEQKGFNSYSAFSGNTAKKLMIKNDFDLILCDFRLPDTDGLKMLQYIKVKSPSTIVIIMTAYSDVKMAVKLIKSGAFDYITKPVQPEEITSIIKRGLNSGSLNEDQSTFEESFVTGSSMAIHEVMEHVKAVSPTDITVLIEGETGSGKEYIAKAIHYASKRRDKPFLAVDCGAIPKELANSELFGHIKGAFTGAINDKKGVFELANGGTLFLDEVGNLPHANQVKLLRALQERKICKVGDNKSIKVDVRLISASNDSLFGKVEKGEFREDLYHRLNGFRIEVPALRERQEDIMEFVHFFLRKANEAFSKNISDIDDQTRQIFFNYYWHGNLRELQNIINRAVLLSKKDVLTVDVLPDELKYHHASAEQSISGKRFGNNNIPDLKEATLITEKEVIQNALQKTNNNKSKAAKLLNIDRKTLYNKIKLYDLEF